MVDIDELEDNPMKDLHTLALEALEEPTLGPASDRDAANYWANLARRLARGVTFTLPADEVPVGAIVRSPAGTIACRYDESVGTVFGDDRPFEWGALASPVHVLWMPPTPTGDDDE